MPSSDDAQTWTRRRVLAACGTAAGVGALAGYGHGADVFADESALTPLNVSSGDWPTMHRDAAHTRTVPAEAAPGFTLTERWTTSFHEATTLIAANGVVIVVREDHPVTYLAAYDILTGEERWQYRTMAAAPQRSISPAIGGDTLYHPYDDADDGDGVVTRAIAIANTGQRWATEPSHAHSLLSHNAGVLLVPDADELIGLNAYTGEERWRSRLGDHLQLMATNGDIVVTHIRSDGLLLGLDASTGDQQWEVEISDHFIDHEEINDDIRGQFVVGNDRVFIHTWGGLLLALELDSGGVDWTAESTAPFTPELIGSESDEGMYAPARLRPVAFTGSELVTINDYYDDSASIRSIDPESGDELWVYDTSTERLLDPAVGGDVVYAPIHNELRLLDLDTGEEERVVDFESRIETVALAGGCCLVTTSDGVVTLEQD